jgi:peptide deformylase
MILKVVKYGNPVLRKKGAGIDSITPEIKKLIEDMFETMYAYKGIGLAAQQIGQAVQLTVIDVRGVTDRPSSLEIKGKPADVEDFMPLVLINPELTLVGEQAPGPEGCLSFPEVFAEI